MNSTRLVRSEELLGRFRSKLDLYKYLTQQGKIASIALLSS
jgi:hypothetical protein